MKPYDENARCEKCGSDDVSTAYKASGYDCYYARRCGMSQWDGEHHDRHCRRCGFEWAESVIAPGRAAGGARRERPMTDASGAEIKPFVPEPGYCRCRHRVKLNEDGSNPCRCCNEPVFDLPADLYDLPELEYSVSTRSDLHDGCDEELRKVSARLAALEREHAAIHEVVGGLEDESTLDAVRDMATEWEHYSREMHKAGYETIPRLTAERDAALARVAELEAEHAALVAAHAELRELLVHRMAVLKFEADCETCERTAALLAAPGSTRGAELLAVVDAAKAVVRGGSEDGRIVYVGWDEWQALKEALAGGRERGED